ncbi:radial spoke head 14 homolog [Callorhinchus milii]|uniref:Radial spoke head 14 homolog n=1 Tax=Callorhinchus milii TaxID=7868 RepID=V9KJC3_CALMI|nr:radial spoke head 14 homolog [Callorhinchus milii]|eukprot:gi/632980232/ref/XP_007906917.1/ PREDICTED: rhabdoid tumor deletion region protein 1 [Callorhinchus milii]
MADTRISAKLPPHIDPTKAPIAFGDRALPKLNRELADPELLTRQRALMALCDLLHDPELAYKAIEIGCLKNLKTLLEDEDSTVRHKTTEILYVLVTHSIGRFAFLKHDVIQPLSKLLDDPQPICRKYMHMALEMLSEIPTGAAGIVDAGLIPPLIEKLRTELDEIQELILQTLHFCLLINTEEALGADAVVVLKEKLDHRSVSIRSKATRAIMDISVPLEGKNKVCEEKVIPLLVKLLKDRETEVRAKAAGALMFAAITTQGKYAALEADVIKPLLVLVNDESSEVRLNAIKTITTVSEAPEGRKVLLDHVDWIEDRSEDPSEAVRKAVKIAIDIITWKP